MVEVMAAIRIEHLTGLAKISDLLSKFMNMTNVYHGYGRCDHIFDIYSDNPSAKEVNDCEDAV